jgi:Concanavalin A-like lectin/glucanases superfamily/Secretion system C-terminal sorting domain/PKD domain
MTHTMRFTLFLLCINCSRTNSLHGQLGQVTIPRIEKMPNQPAPYNLRNWKQVARQYDSFVYDVTKTGQYLPLISIGASGVNYPQNKTIKLFSYVGSPSGSEAINVLPSLVGATLVGNDKSNQYGQNWLLMSQDFFNKANGENIYLNNAGAGSGGDWWYDMMPNVFFYQLYDLYPNIGGEANTQFTTIADRFLEAVRAMGGRDTAWALPNMNYRAWKFKTQQPLATGVIEPEAAGAFAWVLYNAYKKTGNKDYLKGAEWAMEFLSGLTANPSYELQLPYGTYTAAKMNAELGTTYDIPKMVNWSFDKGILRGWGTIVGTWGGFDVSGLVGEANDGGNDYAFQLNGVQQAAALVPMVRYDKRFARAIGKWALNLANATRLFYPKYLPNNLQDASAWSNVHDPNQVVGYEALREKWQGLSPFSTGDALGGGWAGTNLALYGTSSIGYLGSIIEATNVEKILKLDLLKTDFFHGKTYPTYLFYNPYPTNQTVQLDAGSTAVDVYEALSETFITKNITGTTTLTIPANQAILVTLTPANGSVTYERNRMLVNNTVVDYRQTVTPYTRSVRIQALAATQKTIQLGDSTKVYATAFDPDGGVITYKWSTNKGSINGTSKTVTFYAPNTEGVSKIQLIATDIEGNSDTASIDLTVVLKINQAPSIASIQKSIAYIPTNGTVQLTCLATDPNGDPLTYSWTANGGTFNTTNTRATTWIAPNTEGVYQINVSAMDNGNLSAQASTTILVKNFNNTVGKLIAYYPFSNNADDASGNQQHGQTFGTVFVADRNGVPEKACYFNGGTQNVRVNSSTVLNVQNAISVSCWFNAARLPDKETFLLSHGSWQNRWKLSFTPEKNLRWTVNTLNGIADLDAPTPFVIDSFFHVIATYDGALITIYVNGILKAYKTLTGTIRTTTLPFLMGQMLADNAEYNFKGIIDEVKLYDYALTPTTAATLYQQSITAIKDIFLVKKEVIIVAPNPASNIISVLLPSFYVKTKTIMRITDVNGRVVWENGKNTEGPLLNVDISGLVSGVYMIFFQQENETAVGRFVKL